MTYYPGVATERGILAAGTPPLGALAKLGVEPSCSFVLGQSFSL